MSLKTRFAWMVSRGTRSCRISENSTVEYGSSVSSVERVGIVNRRSESLSSAAHLWKESETDNEGARPGDGKGTLSHIGLSEATQFPQPFAPDSPNRGCSDSQNSSSELRRSSDDWPIRDCGVLKALHHRERIMMSDEGRIDLTTQLDIGKARLPFQ